MIDLVLRRADWRFLLRDPNPSKSIVFGEGVLADSAKMISGTTVRPGESRHKNDCDLAVVTEPGHEILEEAWSYLKPGGAVYTEWILSPLSGTNSIRHKLESLGFRDVKFYLPKPSPFNSPPAMWVPLENKGVIDFISYIDKTESVVGKIIKRMRLFLWSLKPNLFVVYPWFMSFEPGKFVVSSVAIKPTGDSVLEKTGDSESLSGAGASAANIQDILAICSEGPDLQSELKNMSIFILSKRESIEKALLFIFSGEGLEPNMVVKIARTKGPDLVLDNGARFLKEINEKFDDIPGIPRIFFLGHVSGLFTTAETFIGGIQSSKAVNKSNYEELALNVTSWLIDFGLKSKVEASKSCVFDRIIKPELEKIEIITNKVLTPEEARRTRDIIESLELPFLVCHHGDFAPLNVHINSKGELGVIDWDDGRFHGIPAFDLIFFLSYLNFHLYRAWNSGNFLDCYRMMLDSSSFTGHIFQSCLERYRESLDISVEAMDALRLLTWVTRTLGYMDIDVARSQAIEDIKTGFSLSLWMEELGRFGSLYDA